MTSANPCPMGLLVQADIDGELDAGRAADLIRHRAQCPDCQAAYADLMMLRDRLRESDLRRSAPDSLRMLLSARMPTASPTPKHLRWHAPAGFAAGAALAAGIALALFQPRAADPLALVVDAHIRALQPGHLEDVISTDRHTVKPWFQGKLDFAPPVKDFAAEQFPLTGGRLDMLDGRPVAALVYQRNTHPINVLVWPAGTQGDSPPITRDLRGFTTIHWVQNGLTLWAVSDLEKSQLEAFVKLWREN